MLSVALILNFDNDPHGRTGLKISFGVGGGQGSARHAPKAQEPVAGPGGMLSRKTLKNRVFSS